MEPFREYVRRGEAVFPRYGPALARSPPISTHSFLNPSEISFKNSSRVANRGIDECVCVMEGGRSVEGGGAAVDIISHVDVDEQEKGFLHRPCRISHTYTIGRKSPRFVRVPIPSHSLPQ
ncbi:hypothetical protein J6590_033708 [Homalodisca vitripennis]|nr:hypothetical protein J6590_033708 [Homalodisca vitripennis]